MKLSYYPGCSIHGSSKEYEISAKIILKNFNLELEEIKDWNCCGAIEASSINHLLSIALPARNLSLFTTNNTNKIIMFCSACQQIHKKAKEELKENKQLQQEITKIINKPINLDIEIKHLLHFIANEIEKEKIKLEVKILLNKLKVIPYYGCSINRPSRFIHGDDPNCPHSLENIIDILGAEILPFSYKTKCCGGAAMLTDEKLYFGMINNILEETKNADCITVVCPLCHLALENAMLKTKFEIPVLYFTQLIGLSFGYQPKQLGLNRHLISTEKLLEKVY